MATRVECWRDNAGKLHNSEHEAWRSNVAAWFIGTGQTNDASARKIVDAIIADDAIVDMISNLLLTKPETPAIAPACPPPPGLSAPPLPPAVRHYREPLTVPRAKCMGGEKCHHGRDECTADPDYRRWIKAENMFNAEYDGAATIDGFSPWERQTEATRQEWLHKAEQAIQKGE